MKSFYILISLLVSSLLIAQNPLSIPPTLSGKNITLNMQTGSVNFFAGPVTNSLGINGNILGPTLILEKDSIVNFTVNNNIGDTSTMHWHGMHVSPENDGGPHTKMLPGATWNPSFTVMDKAATYWYHPHLHGKTNPQVTLGLAGMIIVKDAEEAALNLPRSYGVDDFPLIMQSKAFDGSNQIDVNSHADSTFMVNATINPYLDAPAQVVRFRLLNASSARTLYFGFSNSMTFDQIASDGGLLAAPVNLSRLRLGPGERAEILVDFTGLQSQTINLVNYCEELPIGVYGAEYPALNQFATLPDYPSNPLNLYNYTTLQINVVAQTGSPVQTIPSSLATVIPLLEINSNKSRTIDFGTAFPGTQFLTKPFLMNGVYFDMNVINEYVKLNNIEVWTLNNNTQTTHPFHIHDIQFFILDRDGIPPPLNEQGRKDVVVVSPQETVRFITQFLDFESDTVPYMYHCHMLRHEDMGMMGQFIVSSTVNIESQIVNNNLKIFPNPAFNYLTIESKSTINSINIFDISGRKLASKLNENKVGVSLLKNGIYFITIHNDDGVTTSKFIKK